MEGLEEKTQNYPDRTITRRQAIKVGGIGVLGLVFSKPLIETMVPKPAFADYVVGNGCTPGFWKTHDDAIFWPAGIMKTDLLSSVFDFTGLDASIQALSGDSLQAALGYGGGSGLQNKAKILFRAAVAAYLNAKKFGSAYPLTPTQVQDQVHNALLTANEGAIIALATDLDDKNNDDECVFLISGPATPR